MVVVNDPVLQIFEAEEEAKKILSDGEREVLQIEKDTDIDCDKIKIRSHKETIESINAIKAKEEYNFNQLQRKEEERFTYLIKEVDEYFDSKKDVLVKQAFDYFYDFFAK